MSIKVEHASNIFAEGELVFLADSPDSIYLVTIPAMGHTTGDKDTFWAINLSGDRVSEGNCQKSSFKRFVGTISITQ